MAWYLLSTYCVMNKLLHLKSLISFLFMYAKSALVNDVMFSGRKGFCMQRAKTNGIIAKHVQSIRDGLVSRSFVRLLWFYAVQINTDVALSLGCETACFFYITKTTLNRIGFGMLTMGRAVFNWLYFLTFVYWFQWQQTIQSVSSQVFKYCLQ